MHDRVIVKEWRLWIDVWREWVDRKGEWVDDYSGDGWYRGVLGAKGRASVTVVVGLKVSAKNGHGKIEEWS